jgi:hypothetical protein
VFVNSQCLVKDEGDPPNCVSADDPQDRLISASVDNFAANRKTGLAVNDPKYLPPDAIEHRGLVNKWPFETKRQTYPYWDGTTESAQNAVFDKASKINGLEVYDFRVQVEDEPVEVTDGVQGTYSSDKTITVEPLTGSIVNQVEHRELVTDDGDNFLTLDLAFTPEQVKTSVQDSKDSVGGLNLITSTVPLVGFIVGIPLLIAGIVLAVMATKRERQA